MTPLKRRTDNSYHRFKVPKKGQGKAIIFHVLVYMHKRTKQGKEDGASISCVTPDG